MAKLPRRLKLPGARTPKRRRVKIRRFSKEARRMTLIVSLAVIGSAVAFAAVAAGLGSAVRSDSGCASCHTMQPYVLAQQESQHSEIGCSSCHARPGLTGLLSDGGRYIGWALSDLFSDRVHTAEISERPCLQCHADDLAETITSAGVRVRHSDFADQRCAFCHSGTGHRRADRWYIGPQMEDCMGCHRASITNIASCDKCHPPQEATTRTQGRSAWRATHGPTWDTTHGMGDLSECTTCHEPSDCASCHGIPMPHPAAWPRVHGKGLPHELVESCHTCHAQDFCVNCHGIEMPHGAEFLPVHGPIADRSGEAVCQKCHSQQACDECHFRSSHPSIPAVGMTPHKVGVGSGR